jgi:hypothetical protein
LTSSPVIVSPAKEQLTLDLRTRLGDVRLFTLIVTIGAPLEVTAASLAIETFLPADPTSAERLRTLSASKDS